MEKRDIKQFMDMAVAAASEGISLRDGGPFGAVIVRGGEIVAQAWNRVARTHDPTAHAEINAIREAAAKLGRFHLEDCVLFTSCEPCPMCLGAIYWARLQKVYYAATRENAEETGFGDAMIYRELERPPEQRALPFEQCDAAAATAVMKAWQADPEKTPY